MFVEDASTEITEELPLERLEHEICQLASHTNAGVCRWLELVAEFDRREGWSSWAGCRSCADWISWRCAITPRAAREHVRVARALGEVPRIHAAFARGELSYSKVRALTRVATERSEEELLELATHATAAQLERIVRTYRRVGRDEANDAHDGRYLVWWWEEDGSLAFRGRIPAEDGGLVLDALEAARDDLVADSFESREGGSAEPPVAEAPPAITHADALVAMAETCLARGPTPLDGGRRNSLLVHLDAAALAGRESDRCHVDDGPAIAPDTAQRVACDSSLVTVIERDGVPLSVGRRRRTVPPAIRIALQARDGRCRFPGCEAKRWVDAHHIKHWANGGETALDNLVLLCRRHHRLVHEGDYEVSLSAGGEPLFRDRWGTVLVSSPALPAGSARQLANGNLRHVHEVDAERVLTGTGERMDLDLAVGAVFAAVDD